MTILEVLCWAMKWYNIVTLISLALLLIVNSRIFDWIFDKVWCWRNKDLLDWIDRNNDYDV